MPRRGRGVLVAAFLLLVLSALGCSIGQLVAPEAPTVAAPVRPLRPTWTPAPQDLAVATPTIDATRFPELAGTSAAPAATPQVLVAGAAQGLVLQGSPMPGGVQTVIVIIITATPLPPPGATPPPPAGTPTPTFTPGPPTATPTVTGTPLPPVLVRVKTDGAYVRQGPGNAYLPVTRLDRDTQVTVVGRNRAGDWWKICCVNGMDVWIADAVVDVEGPIWLVPEVTNIQPPPTPTATPLPTATIAPTPTYAWAMRLEKAPEKYTLGLNIFSVSAIIYNGNTPLYGYKLRIRKLSTGQEWLSVGSDAFYTNETVEWPDKDKATPGSVKRRNVKWDSNTIQVPAGDDAWEVTACDGGGAPLSQPVRLETRAGQPFWFYLVFVGR